MIKIELKRISQNERLSEETHCYSADLYVDGVKWGEVGNHGTGGPDDFHGVAGKGWDDIKALDERIAAEMPKIDCLYMGLGEDDPNRFMEQSLEIICGDLVNAHIQAKLMKRELAKKVVYVDAKDGKLYAVAPRKGSAATVASLIPAVAARYPGARILNGMPEAEALVLFRKAG